MSAACEIDKNKVRKSFSIVAETYDGLATLQRKAGLALLTTFPLNNFNSDDENSVIVDIGCGTGFLTQELLKNTDVQQLIAIDIAYSMLKKSKSKLKQDKDVKFICADAESLPLLNQSVDKVYSNLALQWCQNLTAVFDGFNSALRKQGQLVFSTFGPATLQELKQAWSEVDTLTHVNEFFTVEALTVFLQTSGFKDIQIQSKLYQSNYPTVIDLMRELKGIGAHNVLSGRNKKTTTKTQMQNMIDVYEKHRSNGLIPATYEVILISAKT